MRRALSNLCGTIALIFARWYFHLRGLQTPCGVYLGAKAFDPADIEAAFNPDLEPWVL